MLRVARTRDHRMRAPSDVGRRAGSPGTAPAPQRAFDDLLAAQARMEANQHLGKIVLRISP